MAPDAHFLDTLLPSLPTSLAAQIRELRAASPTNQSTLENLIRFILGIDPSPDTQVADWTEKQAELKSVLASLVPNFASQVGLGDRKRSREDEHPSTSGSAAGTNGDAQPDSKKPRLGPADGGSPTPIDPGAPLFTLHALSVTSPIRKKVDITVHENAVVMTHPTSKVVEATIPISFLRRAFVLPTRGKTKPHWTVVLLSADVPDAKGKGAAPAPAGASENQQIIFGVDATTTTAFTTTTYSSQPTPTSHPKGTSTLPLILQLLSHLPSHPTLNPPIQPASQGIFKSACPGIMGAATSASSSELGIPGVEAYRAAKAGNLWFCKEGVLWGESKPCEFWAVGEMDGREGGVRIQGAGRTCSVILIRRLVQDGQEKDAMQVDGQEGGAEEEEVEPGEETEFGMVDSKEREGIQEWVRQHRRLFWLPSSAPSTSSAKVDKGKQKATPSNYPPPQNTGPLTIHTLQDLSDDEDADFDEDGSDLDGSEHSSQEGSSSSKDEEDEEEEEAAGAGSEADANADSDAQDEEDDDDDLDPAHHPLLRPGAMPRMSKAAMQMAVGIVEGAFLGSSAGGAGEEEDEDGDGEDEEDELDE